MVRSLLIHNMKNTLSALFARLAYNWKRLLVAFGIVGLFTITLLVISRITQTAPNDPNSPLSGISPTPQTALTHLGLDPKLNKIAPTEMIFEDPLRAPETIPSYRILPAPNELFSDEGIISIAAAFGFTAAAEPKVLQNAYGYDERGRSITINAGVGLLSYSSPLEDVQANNNPISIDVAMQKTRDLLQRIQFNTPLHIFSTENYLIYEVASDNTPNASPFVTNRGFYEIPITFQIGSLPIFYPGAQYIRIDMHGNIIAARLWYPLLDIANKEDQPIIDWPTAVGRARNGDGIYITRNEDVNTITFTTSNLGYIVPNALVNGVSDNYFLQPVYIFEGDDSTLYVSALP